ncbi:MAG: hypothetical protein K0Q87_1593 [Neobacillus sp.]|jgi:hypothetical protein|nr:hypothetical protein [Neobacillus sp.]
MFFHPSHDLAIAYLVTFEVIGFALGSLLTLYTLAKIFIWIEETKKRNLRRRQAYERFSLRQF